MSDSTVVIKYDYPGTTNGEAVGPVYVQRVADVIPNYPEDVFSYSKNHQEATKFRESVALREISKRYWPNAKIVSLKEAEPLG